jgi:hypothetical protein
VEPTPYEIEQWEKRADQRKAERPGHYIERARVTPIIQRWLDDHRAKYDSTEQGTYAFGHARPAGKSGVRGSGAVATLSFVTGINERQLVRLMNSTPKMRSSKRRGYSSLEIEGGEKYLTLDIVDRLFTGMGLTHLFYLPPEQGGFSDVYWHESVVAA